MKSRHALALIAIAAASGLAQAESQSVQVTATILNTCLFHESFSTLEFPSIDPSGSGEKSLSKSFKYSCTNGAPVSFTVDGSTAGSKTRSLLHTDGTSKMDYAVSWTAPPVVGAGHSVANWVTVPLTATIPETAYQDAKAGSYADEVQVVLTP